MATVSKIFDNKAKQIHAVSADATVYEALKQMAEKNIGALLVIDNELLLGIITERDYARKVMLKGKGSRTTLVKEILTADVISVNSDTSIEACMQIMTSRYIRHLPVFEHGVIIGMISIGDLVKFIIQEKEFIISQLESYIKGSS